MAANHSVPQHDLCFVWYVRACMNMFMIYTFKYVFYIVHSMFHCFIVCFSVIQKVFIYYISSSPLPWVHRSCGNSYKQKGKRQKKKSIFMNQSSTVLRDRPDPIITLTVYPDFNAGVRETTYTLYIWPITVWGQRPVRNITVMLTWPHNWNHDSGKDDKKCQLLENIIETNTMISITV